MNAQEITKAIGAHGLWKSRVQVIIDTGKSETPPEKIQDDGLCDFGKWLKSLPAAEQNCEHYKKVRNLHTLFHREAASVVRTALKQQKAVALEAMGLHGSYTRASGDLTRAMMEWQKALK